MGNYGIMGKNGIKLEICVQIPKFDKSVMLRNGDTDRRQIIGQKFNKSMNQG